MLLLLATAIMKMLPPRQETVFQKIVQTRDFNYNIKEPYEVSSD